MPCQEQQFETVAAAQLCVNCSAVTIAHGLSVGILHSLWTLDSQSRRMQGVVIHLIT